MLEIYLPPDLEKRLSALAEKTGQPATYYAREVIREHLDQIWRTNISPCPESSEICPD